MSLIETGSSIHLDADTKKLGVLISYNLGGGDRVHPRSNAIQQGSINHDFVSNCSACEGTKVALAVHDSLPPLIFLINQCLDFRGLKVVGN
ncbi:hypothetical protein JOD24_001780 [Kroppenstedtia sanguinis]